MEWEGAGCWDVIKVFVKAAIVSIFIALLITIILGRIFGW